MFADCSASIRSPGRRCPGPRSRRRRRIVPGHDRAWVCADGLKASQIGLDKPWSDDQMAQFFGNSVPSDARSARYWCGGPQIFEQKKEKTQVCKTNPCWGDRRKLFHPKHKPRFFTQTPPFSQKNFLSSCTKLLQAAYSLVKCGEEWRTLRQPCGKLIFSATLEIVFTTTG